MRFEILILIWLVAIALNACSNSAPSTVPTLGSAGDQPTFYASASNSAAVGSDTLLLADTKVGAINRFSLNPLALETSSPLPFNATEQSVMVANNGAYSLIIAGGDYAIVDRAGQANKNPVSLAGRVTGVAYDGGTHHLALFDEWGSTALLSIAPDGSAVTSVILGPVVIDIDHLVSAAAMTSAGKLVLALQGQELAIVDVEASIAAGNWTFERRSPDAAAAIDWMAGIADQPNALMVRDGQRLLTIDTTTGAIIDQTDLTGQTPAGAFRGAHPALATAGSSDRLTLFFPDRDAKIKSTAVLLQGNPKVTDGSVDLERGTLTLVSDSQPSGALQENSRRSHDIQQTVARYRLSDSLVVAQIPVPKDSRPVITPEFVLFAASSTMGRLERRNYARVPQTAVLETYNLPLIMTRAAH